MRSLVAVVNDAVGLALCYRHIHRVDDKLCFLIVAHGPTDDATIEGI